MNKLLILFLFIQHSLAQTQIKPLAGLYSCEKGNNDSICDQELRPYFQGDKLTAIKVMSTWDGVAPWVPISIPVKIISARMLV
jgi:hypothetical protein